MKMSSKLTNMMRSKSEAQELKSQLKKTHPDDKATILGLLQKTGEFRSHDEQMLLANKAAENSIKSRLEVRLNEHMNEIINNSYKVQDEFIKLTQLKQSVHETLRPVINDCRQLCKTQMSYERTNAANINKLKDHDMDFKKVNIQLGEVLVLKKVLNTQIEQLKKTRLEFNNFKEYYQTEKEQMETRVTKLEEQ